MSLISQLPKVELHLHIEGTFEPELMFAIAKRNDIKLPYSNMQAVKSAYQFSNLQSFLDIYYAATNCLLFSQDFYDLTWAYLQKMSQENVQHVEIFFDPQTHTYRNIKFEEIIKGIRQALVKGEQELGISSHLIACFLRNLSTDSAESTFEQILDHKDIIIGVGLDSGEIGNPPSKFKNIFKKARNAGFKIVAHAGEEGPPDYIWQALIDLEVDRIDHGIRCMEDPKLIQYLVDKKIPLTVCPLSNVKLKVVSDIKQHPIKKMLEQGLIVTVNSDDPAYFGGYLSENFNAIQQALSLTDDEIIQLVKNSIEASFLHFTDKQRLINSVNLFS